MIKAGRHSMHPFAPNRLNINWWSDVSQLAGGLSLSQINNIVNASNNLVQATGGSQALTVASSLNGKTGLQFDGVASNYTFQLNDEIANGNNVTMGFVIKPTNLIGRFVLYSTRETNTSGQWQVEVGNLGAGLVGAVSVAGAGVRVAVVNNALTVNTPYKIIYTRTGTTQHIYINGVDQTLTDSTPSYNFTAFNATKRVGASNQAGSLGLYFQGLLYAAIGSPIGYSAQQVALLNNYWHTEFNI